MNKKFINGAAVTGLLLMFAFSAAAQTNNPSNDLRQNIRNIRDQFRTEATGIKAKRAELEARLKNKQDEARNQIKTLREKAESAAKARRAQLKDKISKLRDEKKKQIATRLDEQMARLNARWTDHFNNVLDRLSEILAKVELRADKAAANGKDVSAVKTAIANAKTAIETARAAVAVQAKKTYIADFSSEAKLGAAFKAVKEQLRKDLFGLRDGAMKDARRAVQNAFQALKGVPRVDQEATTTPSQNQ